MKFTTAALFLVGSAFAAPSPDGTQAPACTFGTYECTTPNTGIQICDIAGNWELVGNCPNGTACQNIAQNGFDLPFCTNTPTKKKVKARNGRGPSPGDKCQTPGQYTCFGAHAIQVCDVSDILRLVGDCPANSHCSYINNIPYCVANGIWLVPWVAWSELPDVDGS
jgi:hypothetical protein